MVLETIRHAVSIGPFRFSFSNLVCTDSAIQLRKLASFDTEETTDLDFGELRV